MHTPQPSTSPSGRDTIDRFPAFVVGQDRHSHWIALSADGMSGGIFRTCADAVRFACSETRCRPADVPLATEPLSFRL
ncbi:RAG2 PHD domain containing protein [Methylobacterium iners]|uniref:RAG2 PHD domain containing protein n=1 Tax=Methylobacterium iners TaxID=418707 RepID=A0ABQ4RYC9_9HYPH|nr:RAG2 PHD domain containing protein [Methylobacterium iners]GJD95814.1 hypothetical protein OCOJLMKI_3029 [Methylobacterium iners]